MLCCIYVIFYVLGAQVKDYIIRVYEAFQLLNINLTVNLLKLLYCY